MHLNDDKPTIDVELLERMVGVVSAASQSNVTDTLNRIVDAADSFISDSLAATVVLVDAHVSSGLRLAACRGLSQQYRDRMENDPDQFRASAAAYAIRERRPVMVADLQHDPVYRRWWPLARREGYRSLLATPMVVEGTAIGTLNIYRRVPGDLDRRDILLIEMFARLAAGVLQTSLLLAERDNQVAALGHLVRALQDQAHEHANRLQAIRGLIAIGESDGALDFISEISSATSSLRSEISVRISNPTIAGLLVALSGVAAQQGIRVDVDPDSHFDTVPSRVTESQVVTIVGNLVDNAIAAVAEQPVARRFVRLLIIDRDNQLVISVADGGGGLTMPMTDALQWGATSKSDHLGAGLALVNRIVVSAMGVLDARHHAGGTVFTVRIPITDDPS
ncbi:GAF domain-containing protein [Gordonia polyisoprenivorans]|uniref:GAF domain-containing protein n=1 Tax=Gordonia polyisoprenivorans TaxID=84595 RepID=UPI00230016E9|nr:GAF domain-containing protein [Gordonia polyisoprenivorans]WCB36899.1 GAF domain-containing protein [Gordonia polyisoprenivorans]